MGVATGPVVGGPIGATELVVGVVISSVVGLAIVGTAVDTVVSRG